MAGMRIGMPISYAGGFTETAAQVADFERAGLDGDAAVRSREAARSAASSLVHDEDEESSAEDDKAPFRRQE